MVLVMTEKCSGCFVMFALVPVLHKRQNTLGTVPTLKYKKGPKFSGMVRILRKIFTTHIDILTSWLSAAIITAVEARI